MSKVFKTIMSLLCAFTLVFCFSGCDIFSVAGGGGTPWRPPGGDIWDISRDPEDPDSNPEFATGYFDEIIAQFVGVQIMHQPAVGSQSGNAETDAERVRFLSNVMEQFEVMAAYIVLRLVGEFGLGVDGLDGADITYTSANGNGDYTITVPATTPRVENAWIFDDNELAIQRSVTGWKFATDNNDNFIKDDDGKFVVVPIYAETWDMGYSWTVRLENGNYKSMNAQEYMEAYLNAALTYVQICLMQLDAGQSVTTYNTYDPDIAGQTLLSFASNYERLGLVLTDNAGNAAQLGAIDKSDIVQFILQNIIGSRAVNYSSNTKTFEEPFIDWNGDGVWDALLDEPILPAEEFTDWNDNGEYDQREPFTDRNNNGIWDDGEPFEDLNENGVWDSGVDEPLFTSLDDEEGLVFQDYNDNGVRDTNLAEPLFESLDDEEGLVFEDYNKNGIWDAGEPIFRDYNGNGVWDSNIDEPIFKDYNGNGVRDTGLSEPYVEAYGNDFYDFESFVDYNENGVRDTGLTEPFFDANENGVRNANISTDSWFVRGYDAIAEEIADELAILTNEPSENPLFPSVWRLEVVDIAAADFFTPGIEATGSTVRKLNNMDYAQWQSALFVPKVNYQFDMLTFYFDAETSFGLTVYVRVNTADGYFVVPVCFMSLDHTQDCDWDNMEASNGRYEETMDMTGEEFNEAYRRIAMEENFDKEIKRNALTVEMDLVMDAAQMAVIQGGFAGYDGTLDLLGRGYHTNKVDNFVLGNEYDKISLGEDSSMLAYTGEIQSFEILFEIYQPVVGQQYNFKFLIVDSFFGGEDD